MGYFNNIFPQMFNMKNFLICFEFMFDYVDIVLIFPYRTVANAYTMIQFS